MEKRVKTCFGTRFFEILKNKTATLGKERKKKKGKKGRKRKRERKKKKRSFFCIRGCLGGACPPVSYIENVKNLKK